MGMKSDVDIGCYVCCVFGLYYVLVFDDVGVWLLFNLLEELVGNEVCIYFVWS